MGRRSRKRSGGAGAAAPASVATPRVEKARPRRRPLTASASERPRALWHPLPVTEIGILLGLVAAIIGFTRGHNGIVALAVGLGICTVLALELAVREHFTGFRSHAFFLAGGPTVLIIVVLSLLGLHGPLVLAIAAVVFGPLAYLLRARWREASELRSLRG